MLPETCLGCKGCCTNMGVNIFDDEDIIFPTDYLEYTTTPKGRIFKWLKHKENGECIALDSITGYCTIYEHRPRVCRDFDRGSQECLDRL